ACDVAEQSCRGFRYPPYTPRDIARRQLTPDLIAKALLICIRVRVPRAAIDEEVVPPLTATEAKQARLASGEQPPFSGGWVRLPCDPTAQT
ncbi:MAG TPA: hypothetical protein VM600_10120, partial [Actinomycetota bacterium]|nr:hypothetical protein [Actinomycetota bacterium]